MVSRIKTITPPFCSPCSVTQGQAKEETVSDHRGRVFVASAAPESPAAAVRELYLPTDIHSLMQKHTPRSVCTPPPPPPHPLCLHPRNSMMHLNLIIRIQ